MQRIDNRHLDELRPITLQKNFAASAAGSVLISAGKTMILCTASITEEIPKWMPKDSTKGWITAEYRMLPGSTAPRSPRSDRPDGRATEIQRLIGRSLRAIADLEALGPRSVYCDCDVICADGGTRTLSITGAYLALVEALRSIQDKLPDPQKFPLVDSVAAVSVGIVEGRPLLDLCYVEDVDAEVDMNLVMTGSGKFIEIQGTGEEATFTDSQLQEMLALGKIGIAQLTQIQREITLF
ncbi:MAG: ribonuclease PH [Planctomycetaceae bacterium]|nr:ribonuclease PH [Planctomycetaceae bacterium]